jgi:PIN domain nuclease of toxin-antitoxin system
MPMLNLDTHILIHALAGTLRPHERKALSDHNWSISAIVLWELAKLVQLGRISLNLEDREVSRVLQGLHTWPIDLAVTRVSTRLDFNGDPADELIAATSVVNDVPLLTRDRRVKRSKMVPLA